jgi:hypothetical protein
MSKLHTQQTVTAGASHDRTLRKWLGRYNERGLDGPITESRRSKTSSALRIADCEREKIAELRARGMGARRIKGKRQVKRPHDIDISLPTSKDAQEL